jgi:hypothetical protein
MRTWPVRALLVQPLLIVLFLLPAYAGPPFQTDDPVPVALGHYELYVASTGTHVKGDTAGGMPNVELTYGLIPDGQLQIGGELAFDNAGERARSGYGDTQLSFKYRFIREDAKGLTPQVALFPAVFFPTGSQPRGLGAGHARVFLPVWAQFGDWTTCGGGGYWLNRDEETGDKNYWFIGWLLQREITDQLTLGGEVFHQTADTIGGGASTGFSMGGTYDLDDHNHLLVSVGSGLQNPVETNLVSWYLGWELTY